MSINVNEDQFFHEALSLVGRDVEVTTRLHPSVIRGRDTNAMFDSLLVEGNGKKSVIAFRDVLTLLPVTNRPK